MIDAQTRYYVKILGDKLKGSTLSCVPQDIQVLSIQLTLLPYLVLDI